MPAITRWLHVWLLLSLTVVACGSAASTPASAVPTATVAIEQRRVQVVTFLQAYDAAMNAMIDTIHQVQFPEAALKHPDTASAADLQALDTALTSFAAALATGMEAVVAVPQAQAERDTVAILQTSVAFIANAERLTANLQAAVRADDRIALKKQGDAFFSVTNSPSSINRLVEQLLAKYTIPDAEVDYRSRGL